MTTETERILRPSAVLPAQQAQRILQVLQENDVTRGGVWNATTGLWQRYAAPWASAANPLVAAPTPLIGSIAVTYGEPTPYDITIYRVSLTPTGVGLGWDVDRLCDDALAWVGLDLASCPRAAMTVPPQRDPFRVPRPTTL